MMESTVLPFVVVFYNQYYCESFCGCANLQYIDKAMLGDFILMNRTWFTSSFFKIA